MVDSPPSDGKRADGRRADGKHDGDRPTAETDRSTGASDDSDETDETDDQWVAVIEALAARVDPVPEEVRQAARRALHARDKKLRPKDPGAGDNEH